MTETFVARWRDLIARPGTGKFEVDAGHPLRFIVGVNDRQEPLIFVIVDDKPPMPDLSGVIYVERRQRMSDGRWTLGLSLTDIRFLEVYLRLAEDLVYRTADAQNESRAITLMLGIVSEWKRLLARGPQAPLSESALRGLIAELWFGFRLLRREAEPSKIAQAWRAPHGSHQDYVFPLGRRYEVKSRHADSGTIRISSPEQLDAQNLFLAVVTMTEVEPGSPDAVSLPTLVASVRAELALAPDGLIAFDGGLNALGVDPGDSSYADLCFTFTECVEYEVTSQFPAIRRSGIPASIVTATYDVKLGELVPFISVRWPAGTDT